MPATTLSAVDLGPLVPWLYPNLLYSRHLFEETVVLSRKDFSVFGGQTNQGTAQNLFLVVVLRHGTQFFSRPIKFPRNPTSRADRIVLNRAAEYCSIHREVVLISQFAEMLRIQFCLSRLEEFLSKAFLSCKVSSGIGSNLFGHGL